MSFEDDLENQCQARLLNEYYRQEFKEYIDDDDKRESCSCAGENAAFQMGLVPCWALTVLIDSKQIEKCDCFAERK